MPVATTLCGALTAQFDATGALTTLVPSGLWVAPVPEQSAGGPALPYVALQHMGEVPEFTMERAYVETGKVAFACLAVGLEAAEAVATALKAAFDWCSLPIFGAGAVSCERTNYAVAAETQVRAADGQMVFRATVTYKTRLVRTY